MSVTTRQRILDAAITAFATHPRNKVAMVDIAEALGLSGPALYRYFRNREELYYAAVEEDINRLIYATVAQARSLSAPFLSGQYMGIMARDYAAHPLAIAAMETRDPCVMDALLTCESHQLIYAAFSDELEKAYRVGILRQDMPVVAIAGPVVSMLSRTSLPLLLAGKHHEPEWHSIQGVMLAAILYPMPDWQNPDEVAVFVERVQQLGQSEILLAWNPEDPSARQ